ncbi:MAG TPA: aldehyde dehydrogenase (NADP(+)) [Chitinophagaceae bacterium]|nr:aldehyde dehydrogenase (NADP(+)) [Chitinophagaceae bacterium]
MSNTFPPGLLTVEAAVQQAYAACTEYKKTAGSRKAAFLRAIATEITAAGTALVPVTQRETNLPVPRLEGELVRTTKQINLFADLLEEGSWIRAIIDKKADLFVDIRQQQVPLGVVAVFGASNFPFAFSVAGGDTISALAAGCPVVHKGHPAHPETASIVAGCIYTAAEKTGMPTGVFSMVEGFEAGIQLVNHPLVNAVAFTGSFRGGKALYDTAVRRARPIPVYAEMGSVNPVFILPHALQQNGYDIASKLVASNLLGAGQFCTNPGIVVMPPLHDAKNFLETSAQLIATAKTGAMLTQEIHSAYNAGVQKFAGNTAVAVKARAAGIEEDQIPAPHLFVTTAGDFMNDEQLQEEIFGPSSLFIETNEKGELYNIATSLHGQLTATVWGTDEDLREHAELLTILEDKAGRLLINGVPTGVEVTAAMVHGGPYPATTDSRSTSVGTDAIYRFTRPVCYQNFPQHLLPEALKNDNPLGITRIINGFSSRDKI